MFGFRIEALQNDRVRYAKQPIALVVAETLEAATEGARLLAPDLRGRARADRLRRRRALRSGRPSGSAAPPDFDEGRPRRRPCRGRRTRIETEIRDPDPVSQRDGAACHRRRMGRRPADHRHAEPGDRDGAGRRSPPSSASRPRTCICAARSSAAASARRRSSPGRRSSRILAARMLGRPVKLVLPRDQMFGPVGHRGATRQRLRLGMDADGTAHGARAPRRWRRPAASTTSSSRRRTPRTTSMPARRSRRGTAAVRVDTGTPGPMRAPGEASGSAALECAIDEAALACGLDPLEFRLRNYAETDPASGKPFSAKALRECYAAGRRALRLGRAAARAAADARRRRPARRLGHGHARSSRRRCSRPRRAPRCAATAPRSSRPPAADMGQGAWTALAQIAADGLGLDIDQVEFRAGSFRPSRRRHRRRLRPHRDGRQRALQCRQRRHRQARRACHRPTRTRRCSAPAMPASRRATGGSTTAATRRRSESYADILARAGLSALEGRGRGARDPANAEARAMFSHGAVFAEVKVDPDLGQVRVTPARRRLRGRADHQPAAGAQPALWRHDLGRSPSRCTRRRSTTAAPAGR